VVKVELKGKMKPKKRDWGQIVDGYGNLAIGYGSSRNDIWESRSPAKKEAYGFQSSIRRCALNVSADIAEAFGRHPVG